MDILEMHKEPPPPDYTTVAPPLAITLTTNPETRDVLVTLTPPKEPLPVNEKDKRKRAPVDICCVIDISGSMSAEAPIPGEDSECKLECYVSVA